MDICVWKIDDNEISRWKTSCGYAHIMNVQTTPIESGFKVCPYCENKIKQNTVGYIPNYDHYNEYHRRLAKKYGT